VVDLGIIGLYFPFLFQENQKYLVCIPGTDHVRIRAQAAQEQMEMPTRSIFARSKASLMRKIALGQIEKTAERTQQSI
jgi:hypothetical protein